MNDQEYTIKAVGKTVKPWNSQYGPMLTYLVQLEGDGEPVQLNKKDSSPRPEAGDTIYGHIEETDFGRKFKAGKNPNFSGGGSKPARQESPEVQDSIHRSVALNDAALVYQGSGEGPMAILALADDFYAWLTKSDSSAHTQPTSLKEAWDKTTKKDEDIVVDLDDDEVDLNSIPF